MEKRREGGDHQIKIPPSHSALDRNKNRLSVLGERKELYLSHHSLSKSGKKERIANPGGGR